jgi:integrase
MIYKRGKFYWYKFSWFGKSIRESTKQGNDKVARQMEAAHRVSLAKGEVGIRERKVIPSLGAFCKDRLKPWAKSTFETATPNSWNWFRTNVGVICGDKELSALPLNEVNNESLARFASRQLANGKRISYVNSTLRVIRRALHLALEWNVIESVPRVKLLSGENRRDHVVTREEEEQFLAVAEKAEKAKKPEKRDYWEIGHVVICLIETGLRPDEFYRMRWENINWQVCTLFVPGGKTDAARRTLALSVKARFVLEHLWETLNRPTEGWVWKADTKSGHFEQSTIKKQLDAILRLCDKAESEAKQGGHKSGNRPIHVRRFIPYNLRHTYLTRLGESGCDPWTLARIAGHSNITISSRYVHPSQEAMAKAIANLGGHKFGHSEQTTENSPSQENPEISENQEVGWCARRDSNSRPNAPEAFALSS